jgi:hypothetical protein
MADPDYPLMFECSNCGRETTVTREDARGLYPHPDSANAPEVVLQEWGWMWGEAEELVVCPDCAGGMD